MDLHRFNNSRFLFPPILAISESELGGLQHWHEQCFSPPVVNTTCISSFEQYANKNGNLGKHLQLKKVLQLLEMLLHKLNRSSVVFTVRLCLTNPANSPNQRAEVWAVHGSAGTSRHSTRAITLTGGNCWPAESKEPLEQLMVQTVGSWRRGEVGSVSLESTYPHSILAFSLQLPVRGNAETAVELKQVTQKYTIYRWTLGTLILNTSIRLYACAVSKGPQFAFRFLPSNQLTCFVSLTAGGRCSKFRCAREMWSIWRTDICSSITEE